MRTISHYSGSTSASNRTGTDHYIAATCRATYRLPSNTIAFMYSVGGWPWESGSGGAYEIWKNGTKVTSGSASNIIDISSYTNGSEVDLVVSSTSTNHGDPGAGYLTANSQINSVVIVGPN